MRNAFRFIQANWSFKSFSKTSRVTNLFGLIKTDSHLRKVKHHQVPFVGLASGLQSLQFQKSIEKTTQHMTLGHNERDYCIHNLILLGLLTVPFCKRAFNKYTQKDKAERSHYASSGGFWFQLHLFIYIDYLSGCKHKNNWSSCRITDKVFTHKKVVSNNKFDNVN